MQDIYRSTLSLQTYRTWDAVRNVFCHNHRISRVPNSDPQRVAMNVVLKGNAEDDLPAMCLARVAGGRPHPLANLMVGLVLGASPGYFRPGREGAAGAFDPERVRPWSEAAHGWAERTFGDRLVSSVMHLDEVTPHIHLMVFPLDVDGKPRMSSILPNRGALANLHTTYAQALSGLGIGRPVKGGGGGWSGSKDQYWYPYVWTMAFAALPPELLLGSGTVPKLREAGPMHDGAGKARPTSWSPTWLDAERGDGLSADPRKARARLAELQESLDSLRISISRIRREEDVLAASTERDLSLARLVFEPFPYRLVEAASSLWMPVRGTGARHGRAPAGPASADRDRPDLYTADAPSVGHDALDQDSLTVGMGVHIPDGQPVMEEIGCPGDLPAGEELRSPDSQRVREEIGCPGNLPSMEDIRSPDGQPARKGSNRPSGPPVQEGISRTDGQPVYESFGSPSIPQAWAGTGVPINTPARADIRNLGSPQARGDTSGGPINPPATADIRDLGSPQARAGSSGGPTNPPARADIRNLGSPQTLTASGVPSNTPAREYFVGPFTRHGPEAETVPKGGPDRFGGRRQGCGTRPDSSRAVSLGEGLAVTCRRDSWRAVVNGSAGSGMGTVSLMAFLDGTDLSGGAGRELDTACGLADLLGQAGAARALAAHWTASSGKEAARLLEGLLPGPPPSERDWPAAKGRLCAAAGITEAFADRLYREGTLYADHTGAVILSCDAPGTS
ncbi:MAG: plasmid recombination protein, partial [Deltaproteobacteria bacterium]|nr:plasmid recombination protein [Deltaproteobacteria bacterium]